MASYVFTIERLSMAIKVLRLRESILFCEEGEDTREKTATTIVAQSS